MLMEDAEYGYGLVTEEVVTSQPVTSAPVRSGLPESWRKYSSPELEATIRQAYQEEAKLTRARAQIKVLTRSLRVLQARFQTARRNSRRAVVYNRRIELSVLTGVRDMYKEYAHRKVELLQQLYVMARHLVSARPGGVKPFIPSTHLPALLHDVATPANNPDYDNDDDDVTDDEDDVEVVAPAAVDDDASNSSSNSRGVEEQTQWVFSADGTAVPLDSLATLHNELLLAGNSHVVLDNSTLYPH